jgi:hypothetical protein
MSNANANVPSPNEKDPRFIKVTDKPDVGDEVFRYSERKKVFISYIVKEIETKTTTDKIRMTFYKIKFNDESTYDCMYIDHELKMYISGHGFFNLYKYNNGYVRVRHGVGHRENGKGRIQGGRRTLRKSSKRRGKSQKRR